VTDLNLVAPLSVLVNRGPFALGLMLLMGPSGSPVPSAHLAPAPRRLNRKGLTGCLRSAELHGHQPTRNGETGSADQLIGIEGPTGCHWAQVLKREEYPR
jgi:hypothetical protein